MPDFRYVGLEPVMTPNLGVAATALGLGAGVSVAMSCFDAHHALFAGVLASTLSAFALRGAGTPPAPRAGSARMAIVPWGVLVEKDEAPRILRWAAVRRIEVEAPSDEDERSLRPWGFWGRPPASRVAIQTDHDRFVGETRHGVVPLERLVAHVEAWAVEQSMPLALDLGLREHAPPLDPTEPACEPLIGAARDWLETAAAVVDLGLPPAGYRRTCAQAPTPHAVDVLRRILRDRTRRDEGRADPRAFAAVVAAEIHATDLAADLVALTESPHPIVAAVARQAARRLGAARAHTGTVEEIGPFLSEIDRARLEAWT
ncbi:MAG: hypothetical protein KF819_19920 [Labilithrix sp.]|nr:hypothetical protein [Labilithrix sp.]